jgi:hypothetical protein
MAGKRSVGRWLASGVLGLGLGLGGVGCHGSQDGTGALLASGTAALGSDLSALPPGGIPGLPASPALLEGPLVDITSPARATFTTDRKVTVEGVVTDLGGGVSDVRVAGRAVTPDASGAFRAEVDLEPGMNTITVEAWDQSNHRRERFVSVLAGDLAPETDPVAQAASLRVTDAALDLIEPAIAQGIEAQRAQLVQQVLATPVGDGTTIKGFRFGAVHAGVDLVAGGARFTVSIDDLAMDIETKTKVLLVFTSTKSGTVRASRLDIEGVATIGAQGGKVSTNVVQVKATTQGFSVPDYASSQAATIRATFERGFAAAAAKGIADGLAKAFATTSGTITPPAGLAGPAVSLDWALSSLACDDAGATAVFSANARVATPTVGQETRSLVVGGGIANLAGGGATGPNVALAVHQDLVNRALHAAWRGGALRLTLDQATLQRLSPQTQVTLDTTTLIGLAPELAAVVQPGLPVELEVDGELPAVMRLRGAPLPDVLDVGALKVTTFVLDPVKGRTALGEASYALHAEVGVVANGGQLTLAPQGQVEVHVDALGAPQPGAELVLEELARAVGPQLLQLALTSQQGLVLPAVQGYSVGGLQVQGMDANLILLGTAQAAAPAP